MRKGWYNLAIAPRLSDHTLSAPIRSSETKKRDHLSRQLFFLGPWARCPLGGCQPAPASQLVSLIAWNCHGLGDIKLVEHDTMEYIRLFDIVVLTETQTAADVNLMHQLFSGYTLQSIDANSTGRAGEGTLLAVKDRLPFSVSGHSVDTSNSAICMTLKSCNAQQPPLTVGVCYAPPPG